MCSEVNKLHQDSDAQVFREPSEYSHRAPLQISECNEKGFHIHEAPQDITSFCRQVETKASTAGQLGSF